MPSFLYRALLFKPPGDPDPLGIEPLSVAPQEQRALLAAARLVEVALQPAHSLGGKRHFFRHPLYAEYRITPSEVSERAWLKADSWFHRVCTRSNQRPARKLSRESSALNLPYWGKSSYATFTPSTYDKRSIVDWKTSKPAVRSRKRNLRQGCQSGSNRKNHGRILKDLLRKP